MLNDNLTETTLVAYNTRHGVFMRPNSPNTKPLPQTRNSRNTHPTLNPIHRLNNTVASNFNHEEEKNEPTPTPLEEYK